MSSSSGKKQSTETPPKNIFTKLLSSRRKRDKEVGKKQSTEGINNNNNNKKDDDAAGMLTCEENAAGEPSPGAGSPMSIKQKRKKKKGNKEGTVEEDETLKAKKSKEKKEEKEKDELKTAKKKKKSGKKDKTEEAPPQPSGMATVFEPIKTPSRPAVAHHKEMNKNFQEDMERIEREEKREKDKDKQQIQQPIDEFAPTVFEPVQAAIQPAVSSGKPKKQLRQGVSPAFVSPAPDSSENEAKPVYLSIPKENATTARERKSGSHQRSAESTKTGKEGSKKAVQHSDSQDDADCKTAMIPASAVKVAPYQMVMYKGVPRYEPVNKSSRPYIKSEKEVAAKIQMLPQPCTAPTSPTLPSSDQNQNNYNNNNNGPKSPAKSPATSPGNKGIIIGTLPKDQQQQPPPAEDPKLAPVSQYIAPLDR